MAQLAATYGHGIARIQFLTKSRAVFASTRRKWLNTRRPVQPTPWKAIKGRRPCLSDLTDRMAAIDVPMLSGERRRRRTSMPGALSPDQACRLKAGLSIVPQDWSCREPRRAAGVQSDTRRLLASSGPRQVGSAVRAPRSIQSGAWGQTHTGLAPICGGSSPRKRQPLFRAVQSIAAEAADQQ